MTHGNEKGNMHQLPDLSGKTALVTGGAGLLGKHFCWALALAGANVAVVDNDEKRIAETIRDIKAGIEDASAVSFCCDITDATAVDTLVMDVVGKFGAIDILHNNAASKGKSLEEFMKPVESFNMKTWRDVMEVNIDAMFMVARSVGAQMIAQATGGAIVQTSSIYGFMSPDHRIYEGSSYRGQQIQSPAVYSASKAAVHGLTTYLAGYWAEYGIRVNTLTLGGVDTGQNQTFKSRYSERVPLKRMARPEEVQGPLLFLCSDQSSYVTGQNLFVDGGLSAW